MPTKVRLTQESLLGFLSSTGLPLVSRLATVVRWLALGLTVASLLYGVFALLRWGVLWKAELPWSGALPALLSTPLYVLAFAQARVRMQFAVFGLVAALFVLSMVAAWPRGPFSIGWYVQPFLALVATCSLGVVTGLSMTLVAVVVLLAMAVTHASGVPGVTEPPDLWVHSTSLAALTLASALAGALVHKMLLAAVQAAEMQRRRHQQSSRALRYREKLLRHALRLETIGDLAGMVVHQLRNSFQVMIGHATLAADGDDEERSRRLPAIADTLRACQPLLDQLMVLAHPQDGSPSPEDLDRLVDEFHRKARNLLPAAVTLRREQHDGPLPVLVDPIGLEHALWNLLINARHAIGGKGEIVLRTGSDSASVWVAVEDSGCGIPPEIQARIFDPYFTTKPPGEGTGLGLTAVARFVRGSNGSVEVRSAVGAGSEFVLSFPLRAEQGAAIA